MSGDNEATLLIRVKEAGKEILEHFVFTLNDVKELVMELPKFLMECVTEFRKQEEAVNSLTNAMMQQGVFTGELRNEYLEMAEALEKKTIYDKDDIVAMEAKLQQMIKNKVVSKELLQATVDLAAGGKMDLMSAAQLVGKAVESETNVLHRQGIEVRDLGDETHRLDNVIKGIENTYRGHAEMQTKGLGVLTQLKLAWEEFMKSVGGLIAPLITQMAHASKSALEFFTALMPKNIDYSKQSVNELSLGILKMRREIEHLKEIEELTGKDNIWDKKYQDLENAMAQMRVAREKLLADEKAAADRSLEIDREKNAALSEAQQKRMISKQDQLILEAQMEGATGDQLVSIKVKEIDKKIDAEANGQVRKKLIIDRGHLVEAQAQAIRDKQALQLTSLFQTQKADMISAGADLVTAIGDKESKEIFLLQKAAALATTWILTQVASAQAMASIPYPANLAAAANIEVIGYIKMATIAATAIKGLEDGGIVKARPGGGLYQIGEGGRDEAVIPLENGMIPGMSGGGLTVNFNGSFLGDENQAMEVAKVLDRAFLKLKQSNQSVAFDSEF